MNEKKLVILLLFIFLYFGIVSIFCSRTKELSTTTVPKYRSEEAISQTETEEAEIPPPGIGERDYYKIQIFAAQNFDKAQTEKERLKKYTEKSIFLVYEKKLWKVQVGDFPTRKDAENERGLLRRLGWVDAWLIQCRIISNPKDTLQISPSQTISEPETYFTVQLIATTNKTEAENLHKNLSLLNVTTAVLFKEGDFWKIQVGRFGNIQEATKMLDQMKKMGFNDSWITKRIRRLLEKV